MVSEELVIDVSCRQTMRIAGIFPISTRKVLYVQKIIYAGIYISRTTSNVELSSLFIIVRYCSGKPMGYYVNRLWNVLYGRRLYTLCYCIMKGIKQWRVWRQGLKLMFIKWCWENMFSKGLALTWVAIERKQGRARQESFWKKLWKNGHYQSGHSLWRNHSFINRL